MEESAWSSECKTLKVSYSFPRGRPRKTGVEIFTRDLKERKVSWELPKDGNVWKSFILNCPTHASLEIRHLNECDDELM